MYHACLINGSTTYIVVSYLSSFNTVKLQNYYHINKENCTFFVLNFQRWIGFIAYAYHLILCDIEAFYFDSHNVPYLPLCLISPLLKPSATNQTSVKSRCKHTPPPDQPASRRQPSSPVFFYFFSEFSGFTMLQYFIFIS